MASQGKTSTSTNSERSEKFQALVRDPSFPCVGAKAALQNGRMETIIARDIRSAWNDLEIIRGLIDNSNAYREDGEIFRTLVVIFETPSDLSEKEFEQHMWDRVQSLSDKDEWLGFDHDDRVSADPDNPHFSLSFGGEAYFVIGGHPKASREARRWPRPTLVFNVHDQFETLRKEGRYEKLRRAIIERDIELDGTPNPMLARHGDKSEARQYSGRQVGNDWECPYERKADPD